MKDLRILQLSTSEIKAYQTATGSILNFYCKEVPEGSLHVELAGGSVNPCNFSTRQFGNIFSEFKMHIS